MKSCQNCGESAVRAVDGWQLCAKCADRFAEQNEMYITVEAGKIPWNPSKYDPFYRGWLLSHELFSTLYENAPRFGRKIWSSHLGGDVFEYGEGSSCWVQLWRAPNELLVAYPSVVERYGCVDTREGIHEFDGWIEALRHSQPLDLGHVRNRCSYGAYVIPGHSLPIVKWAQWGDWASLARSWFVGVGRTLAPWP